MNKQELIKEFREVGIYNLSIFGAEIKGIPTESAIALIEQLDEPKPVKIPQFVADWIEVCKEHLTTSLYTAMNPDFMKENNQSFDFILWIKKMSNQETFARAWLDGYEVEKEKKYYVRFKWIEDSYSYLTLIKHLHAWTLKNITLDKKFRTAHTREQLEEADFGWVFDCPGIEIEEVE